MSRGRAGKTMRNSCRSWLLTPEAQRLFRLRFLEGREWSEIAEMEGTTVDDCRKSFERQVRPLAEGLALQIEQPIDDCVRETGLTLASGFSVSHVVQVVRQCR